jgi:hypothetical protein
MRSLEKIPGVLLDKSLEPGTWVTAGSASGVSTCNAISSNSKLLPASSVEEPSLLQLF